ncbi:MAG TPA: hypothetical protein VGC45_15750 [Gryllotalpicola sp.]
MADESIAADLQAAFEDLFHTLWDGAEPDVLISDGHPGRIDADDAVALMGVSQEEVPGPISATRRVREETLTVTVVISCYRVGGQDQQRIVDARALKLLGDLSNHLRKTDPTLGGLCVWCFRTSFDLEKSADPAVLTDGRLTEINAKFTAVARIRTS